MRGVEVNRPVAWLRNNNRRPGCIDAGSRRGRCRRAPAPHCEARTGAQKAREKGK